MLSYTSSMEEFLSASESEIVDYCKLAPCLAPGIFRLSDEVVAKRGFGISDHEFQNQKHAWENLKHRGKLRIPKPFRFLAGTAPNGIDTSYLLMEYINGHTLEERHELDDTIIRKVVEAIQYMQDSTSDPSHRPGPITGGLAYGFPWGLDGAEIEFHTLADVDHCINRRLAKTKQGGSLVLQGRNCALYHGDLALRNILITDADEIVFLDWENACYYPPILEFASLYLQRADVEPRQQAFFDSVLSKLLKRTGDEQEEENMKAVERVHIISICRSFRN